MKRTAWRIYNVFRGPVGLTGQMGNEGQPGKLGEVPVEWEHRLDGLEARVHDLVTTFNRHIDNHD